MPAVFILAVTDSGAGAGVAALGIFGVFGVFSILMYFLPTFVAGLRHHHNGGAIFLLNLLLGWTLLGWVLALVWSVTGTHRQLQQVQQPPQPAKPGRGSPAYQLNAGPQKPLPEVQGQSSSDSRLNEQLQCDNKSHQISPQQTATGTEEIDWFKTSLICSCVAAVIVPFFLIYSCTRSHSANAYAQATPTPAATVVVEPTPASTPEPVQAKLAPTPYVTPTPYENLVAPTPTASLGEIAHSKSVPKWNPVDSSSLIHAEDWLNVIYAQVQRRLDRQGKQKLKKDELAWIAYKDSLPAAERLLAIENRISTLERQYGGKSLLDGNPPDSEIKAELLGYWRSPRHDYVLKSDGIMYMCPTREVSTKNKWDVKAGQFYQDGEGFKIVTFNDLEFAYQDFRDDRITFTLLRITEKEAEGGK
jgi:hypothetical protein